MTQKEIIDIEQENTGHINLYLEGTFYKAYEQYAFAFAPAPATIWTAAGRRPFARSQPHTFFSRSGTQGKDSRNILEGKIEMMRILSGLNTYALAAVTNVPISITD